jgi:hypothetical protein
MAAKRRRNPAKRSRLTPGEEGGLSARKHYIASFAKLAADGLMDGQSLTTWVEHGRHAEMSLVQIRKGLRQAVNLVLAQIVNVQRRYRRL